MRHKPKTPDELRAIEQPFMEREEFLAASWASLASITHGARKGELEILRFYFYMGAHAGLGHLHEEPERILAMERELSEFLTEVTGQYPVVNTH